MSIRLPYNNETRTYFLLTLSERNGTLINTGSTYSIQFTHEQSGTVYSSPEIEEESLYPNTFSRLYLTTQLTGVTSGITQNIAFKYQGWYTYRVYLWSDRVTKATLLELGRAYIYDNSTTVENKPEPVKTYTEDKTKYVYTK